MFARIARVAPALLLAALASCASLPAQVVRVPSAAVVDDGSTALQRVARASLPAGEPAERSGFLLLPDGPQAFDARIELVRRAERSVDAQYYLIADDRSGSEFVAELERAAARGVRVRLLVDDLHATGQDRRWAALATRPGIEVRLFNPLPARSGRMVQRFAFSISAWPRINRRMHNKLLTVDSAFAVTGGRNIADAYFDRSAGANFIDLDVLAAGPVVGELAAVFDRYWNAAAAYPVESLAPAATRIAAARAPAPIAPPVAGASGALQEALARGALALEPGDATVVADEPGKAAGDAACAVVAHAYERLLAGARSRVVASSPYIIPSESTLLLLDALRKRDVAVSLLTNSGASTDEPLVHYGYARRRVALIRAGVELRELFGGAASTAPAGPIGGGSSSSVSTGRLHAKVAVVDGETAFIGSMNMDPRSAVLNTEAGLVIRSRTLAARLEASLRQRAQAESYRLALRNDALVWSRGGDLPAVEVEPDGATRPALALRMLVHIFGDGLL